MDKLKKLLQRDGKVNKFLLLFFLIGANVGTSAQNNLLKPSTKAQQTILALKDSGTVVVVLPSIEITVMLLRQKGFNPRSNPMETEKKIICDSIISAFARFNFYNVLFTTSSHIPVLKEKNHTDYYLQNSNGQNFKLPISNYVIVELGNIELEGTNDQNGLAAYDSNYKFLPKPFPSFISKAVTFYIKVDERNQKMIKRFDQKLFKYHAKTIKKLHNAKQ